MTTTTTSASLAHAQKVVREQQQAVDDGDDDGEHVGLVRYRRHVLDGMQIILGIWEDAEGAAAEPGSLRPS